MHFFESYNTFSFHLFNMNFNMIFEENFTKERWMKPFPAMHYHKSWELYFVNSGSIEVDCNDRINVYSESEITFIPPYAEHCIVRTTEDANYASIRFSFTSAVNDPISESLAQMFHNHVCTPIEALPETWEVLSQLKSQYREYVESGQPKIWLYQKITASCLSLMTVILEAVSAKADIHPNNFTVENDFLTLIIEFFMMYDSESNITITQLAENLNYSVSQTNRILRQNFGKSFKDLAKEIRIKRAKYFLEKTDFSLTKIADILGFQEAKAFNRFFKASEGVTPTQYRKEYIE